MKKTSIIVAFIGLSGAFAIAASRSEPLLLQLFFVLLSLLTVITVLFYLGGLPCKNLFREAFTLCGRCLGFYAGGLTSIIISLILYFFAQDIPMVSSKTAIILLIIAFLIDLPTMYHGFSRRYLKRDYFPNKSVLFLTGFLNGISIIITFFALCSLLSNLNFR